jgi:hypothetical protein
MAEFSVVVEVMFNGVNWTNITSYVRVSDGISITRGRGDEQGEVAPGTMSLVLINDGRFTPGLASGAYYPNVKKGRRIRCRVVVGVNSYTRFDGYVNEWPVAWEGGTALSLVSITCTDLFKRLGMVAPMRSLLEEEMLALDPDLYYTFSEPDGATSAGDTSGNGWRSMAIAPDNPSAAGRGTITFGTAEGPGVDGLTAAHFLYGGAFTGDTTQGKHLQVALPPGSGGYAIGIWFIKDGPDAEPQAAWNLFSLADNQKSDTDDPDREGVQFNANIFGVRGSANAMINLYAQSDESVDFSDLEPDAEWPNIDFFDEDNHFLGILIDGSGNVSTYLDGELASFTYAWPDSIRVNFYRRLIVGGGTHSGSGNSTMFDGTLSHVWMKRTGTMPDWANVWATGSSTTTLVTARFTRLCALLGLTGSILGTSSTLMDAQAAGGKAPIQALQDVAEVENGLVYASRSSAEIIFECRNYRYNKASSLTLTDADIQGDLTWSDDDQPLVNDVTNQRDGGAEQRVIDQDSIDEYGIYSGGESQPWASDADALAAAQWAVSIGADPPPRVTQVTVMANALTLHEDVLDLEISDVVTLSGLPSNSPETTVALHVEGYSETISHNYHAVTYNTSPAAHSDVWQLQIAGRSELGLTTRLGV